MAADPKKRMSITPTFKEDEREHWERLHERAEAEGISPSELARLLIIQALSHDPDEANRQAMVGIEERLDTLTRNVARGAFIVLKASELRAAGEEVPDAEQWTHQVMVLNEA